MSKDTLIQELSKWQHVIDSQIERRGEAALLRRTTEALLHAMDDAKGYKTNWDVCELKRKAEENQREISGDFDFTKAQAFNLKVLGLTVAEISIMKNWFESKSGKNITDFWKRRLTLVSGHHNT